MLFKRKWITNFIWILAMIVIIIMGAQYAFLYGIDFLFAGNSVFAQWTSVSYSALDMGLVIWIVIYLAICLVIFLIVRGISNLVSLHYTGTAHTTNILQILLICAVLLAAFLYRGYILITSDTIVLGDSRWFDAAAGILRGDGTDITPLTIHGASFVYITILNFLMQFLRLINLINTVHYNLFFYV